MIVRPRHRAYGGGESEVAGVTQQLFMNGAEFYIGSTLLYVRHFIGKLWGLLSLRVNT